MSKSYNCDFCGRAPEKGDEQKTRYSNPSYPEGWAVLNLRLATDKHAGLMYRRDLDMCDDCVPAFTHNRSGRFLVGVEADDATTALVKALNDLVSETVGHDLEVPDEQDTH